MGSLKKILVVDDEAMMRNLLFEVLSGQGFQVTLAKDGRDSLRLMKKGRFDLLITDIHMPRLDGIEMLRCMKRAKRREKVIVMSGMKREQMDLDRPDIPPVMSLLRKPFPVDRFLDVVETALQKTSKKQKREATKARYH